MEDGSGHDRTALMQWGGVRHAVWECVSHCVGLGYLHRIPTAPVTKRCVNALLHLERGAVFADGLSSSWHIDERAAAVWFMASPVSQFGPLQFELSATRRSQMQPYLSWISVKHPSSITKCLGKGGARTWYSFPNATHLELKSCSCSKNTSIQSSNLPHHQMWMIFYNQMIWFLLWRSTYFVLWCAALMVIISI